MGDSSPNIPKINHHAIRESQEKKTQERKRNILLLIHSFLKENGFENTVESLEKETHLLTNFEICDNVDLDTILQEYSSYYFCKFGKYPKICKKASGTPEITEKRKPNRPQTRPKSKIEEVEKTDNDFEISIRSIGSDNRETIQDEIKDLPQSVSMMNLADYPPEWKEMFQVITREIVPKTLGYKWSDCIGMDHIKRLLEEAIIYPIKYPEFFEYVAPWKGVLLYGPPGTGKTLIAKALACETESTLINISPSTFISKWRGESEKLIRCLFEVAEKCAPCILFIDEIDALASSREVQQHEASRRFKSELLTQMDGILDNNQQIFILATTNLPWEIDSAILRRFDKKVLVNLPNDDSRYKMFEKLLNLKGFKISKDRLIHLAERTVNFSGNDIKLVYKSASMAAVRRSIEEIKRKGHNYDKIDTRCLPVVQDIYDAIEHVKPSSSDDKYLKWQHNIESI